MCAKARYILIHYATNGLVPHEAIMGMLKRRGWSSFRDIPVRAYSSRPAAKSAVTTYRIYWCETLTGATR